MSITTATVTNRNAALRSGAANPRIEQPQFQIGNLHECINIKTCGFCWWRMKSKSKASCNVR